MKTEFERSFTDLTKAVDFALWLKFKYRIDQREFTIEQDEKSGFYHVIPSDKEMKSTVKIPDDYSDMTYEQIGAIHNDLIPLDHWQELGEMVSTAHDELLRFILFYQVPLEKWVRYELATRGHDDQYHWIGIEKSKQLWLTEAYVILIADESGKFDWFYNDPQPFYPTLQEAEEVRKKLISQEEYLTETNCKVQRMYHLNV